MGQAWRGLPQGFLCQACPRLHASMAATRAGTEGGSKALPWPSSLGERSGRQNELSRAGRAFRGWGQGVRTRLHGRLTESGHLPQLPKLPLKPMKQTLWGCDPAIGICQVPPGRPKVNTGLGATRVGGCWVPAGSPFRHPPQPDSEGRLESRVGEDGCRSCPGLSHCP